MSTPVDITQYIPAVGDQGYPDKIKSALLAIQSFLTEIENSREGQPTLKAQIDVMVTAISNLSSGAYFVGSSVSSLLIGTGAKTFAITEAQRAWTSGTKLRITSRANPANFMTGNVTTYDSVGNTLSFNCTAVGGAGTFADWSIGFDSGTSSVTALTPGSATALQRLRINVAGSAVEGVSDPVWTVKSANYNAVAGDLLLLDSSAGPFTVTMPAAPAVGDKVRMRDLAGTFATNNVTVGRNGNKIFGLSEDHFMDRARWDYEFVWSGVTQGWV